MAGIKACTKSIFTAIAAHSRSRLPYYGRGDEPSSGLTVPDPRRSTTLHTRAHGDLYEASHRCYHRGKQKEPQERRSERHNPTNTLRTRSDAASMTRRVFVIRKPIRWLYEGSGLAIFTATPALSIDLRLRLRLLNGVQAGRLGK